MQYELRELQQRLGITFVFVTHDQERNLRHGDWIFVMNDGGCQSGTPVDDIYDEPILLLPLLVSQISCLVPWLKTT